MLIERRPRIHVDGWRRIAIGVGLGIAIITGLRRFVDFGRVRRSVDFGRVRRSWWEPQTYRHDWHASEVHENTDVTHIPVQTTPVADPLPEETPLRPETALETSPAVGSDSDIVTMEVHDMEPRRETRPRADVPEREPAMPHPPAIETPEGEPPAAIVNPDAALKAPDEEAGWNVVHPFNEDDMHTTTLEMLQQNPNASYDEVLAAWHVRRGATIEPDEAEKLRAIYGRLNETYEGAA